MSLQHELEVGSIRITFDPSTSRYVLRAAGEGRDIVVPSSADALVPPAPPPRDPKNLLSPFVLRDASRAAINVPWSAIVRNHGRPTAIPTGACLGCDRENCAHGWPGATDITPGAVVVLRLRSTTSYVYGWYVRMERLPSELVRMPAPVVDEMVDLLTSDPALHTSALLRKYQETPELGETFHRLALARFADYRASVTSALGKKRRRDEIAPKDSGSAPTAPSTCIICLEEQPTSRQRCRKGTCAQLVCHSCHVDSRGLCPICDRSAINADYPCSGCNKFSRLSQFGFACVGCGAHSLCRSCYVEFSECSACEVV